MPTDSNFLAANTLFSGDPIHDAGLKSCSRRQSGWWNPGGARDGAIPFFLGRVSSGKTRRHVTLQFGADCARMQ